MESGCVSAVSGISGVLLGNAFVAVRDFLTTGDGTENECGVDLIGTRDQSLGEHVGKTGSLAHDARQFLVSQSDARFHGRETPYPAAAGVNPARGAGSG